MVKTYSTIFSAYLLMMFIRVSSQTINFEDGVKSTDKIEAKIIAELNKYPKGLLQPYLKRIDVVSDERFCGRAEAYSNRIVLSASCNGDIRETIHHELSSIFLLLFDGSGKPVSETPILDSLYRAFLQLNGDYKYSFENGIYSTEVINSALADRFYLYKYGSRDFENDFNIIVQCLFRDGSKTIEFMDSNTEKPVAKKIRLVIDFYQTLNPAINISYFKHQLIN